VRHILIILSFLLLSSPVIGQSSKYESVSQCVLQTMTEKKLTGNKMFEMVKEECEKYFEKLKKRKGVLFFINRNRKLGWYENGDEKKDGKYVGDIENKVPNGQGTFTSPDGKKYDGEWKDGTYHGHGTYTFGKGKWEGDKYFGEYKNGKKDGQGTYTFSDGRKYVGEFKDGKKHGQGTFTTPYGNKYVGEFKDGKQDGQGTLTSRFEKEYVGEFKEGTLWNITEYDKNGNILGKWVNGKLKVK